MSPEAAEKVKQELMKARGMSKAEADQFYISDTRCFVNKVERHVPDPDALVKALEMVRAMFADCKVLVLSMLWMFVMVSFGLA